MINIKIKNMFIIKIPYFPNKRFEIHLTLLTDNKIKKLQLSVWKTRRLVDIKGYEDKWGFNWWKIITLWKKR
jgi:hypothetical protein